MADPFDTADLYDARDAEHLTCTDPIDAVRDLVDEGDWEDEPHPIVVTAYVVQHDELFLYELADSVAERAVEDAEDTLANESAGLRDGDAEALKQAIIADVVRVLRGIGVLYRVGTRTYSIEEVRRILDNLDLPARERGAGPVAEAIAYRMHNTICDMAEDGRRKRNRRKKRRKGGDG